MMILAGCNGAGADAAACDRLQMKVRAAHRDSEGGVLQYINLRSDEDFAANVPGRPENCPVPPSES